MNITEADIKRWRQLSDELNDQAVKLKAEGQFGTRNEWEAVLEIESASRHLWSAFGWLALQQREDTNS